MGDCAVVSYYRELVPHEVAVHADAAAVEPYDVFVAVVDASLAPELDSVESFHAYLEDGVLEGVFARDRSHFASVFIQDVVKTAAEQRCDTYQAIRESVWVGDIGVSELAVRGPARRAESEEVQNSRMVSAVGLFAPNV